MPNYSLYTCHSCYPLPNAERNLAGRTHYVDEATRRYFRANVIASFACLSGLAFSIIETLPVPGYARRRYRPVLFDLAGRVIDSGPTNANNLNAGFSTEKAARAHLDATIDRLQGTAIANITRDSLTSECRFQQDRARQALAHVDDYEAGGRDPSRSTFREIRQTQPTT